METMPRAGRHARTLVVTVKDTVPVMLVNGKPAVEAFDQATGYLRVALNPFDKGIMRRERPARPKVRQRDRSSPTKGWAI